VNRFQSKRDRLITNHPAWNFQTFGHYVTLIQSGMGVSNAERAATHAAALAPEVIISAGFCGALSTEIAVGEVFLADRLYGYSSGSITTGLFPDQELTAQIGTAFRRCTFITADKIVEKARIYSLLPDRAAINMLEMESAAVAAVCRAKNIKFIALRSVTDKADEDPSRLLQQVCDTGFKVRIARVALSLIKRPSLLPEYVQLYRNSAIAGETLSEGLSYTLEHIRCL
jgi:adenosylhomocysteine nucleosidase